jgi:hypothetical protein
MRGVVSLGELQIAKLIRRFSTGGQLKIDLGIDPGSGIISFLQGIGVGSLRSWSPSKSLPCTLPILYFIESINFLVL